MIIVSLVFLSSSIMKTSLGDSYFVVKLKVPAIRTTNHQKLVDSSKLPSQGLRERTEVTRATNSANSRTNLVSRASKSASLGRLPTVMQRSSLVAERRRVVTPKIGSNLSVNPSHKSSTSGTRMPVHAKGTSYALVIFQFFYQNYFTLAVIYVHHVVRRSFW